MSMQSRRNIIIAGANFAGLTLARSLCSKRFQVTVIDPGKDFEWYPNIHEVISRRKRPEQLRHDRRTVLSRLGHGFHQASVTAIDRDRRRIQTSLEQSLPYDDLVLCVGNSGSIDRLPGARDNALPCATVADAEQISRQLQRLDALSLPDRPVVLIGANFVGLELLGEIIRRYRRQWRFRLQVVDAMPVMMPGWKGLDDWIRQECRGMDIEWVLGRKVSAIDPGRVVLDNGQILDSRLTLWCGGGTAHPLPAASGLAPPGAHAGVTPTLQSLADPRIWIAGDAMAFPEPLDKQAFHAMGTARRIAANIRLLAEGKEAQAYRPMPTPRILSFGDSGVALFRSRAIAHPSVLAGKEAVYQANYHWLMPPKLADEWQELREGVTDSMTGMGSLMLKQLRNRNLLRARYFPAA